MEAGPGAIVQDKPHIPAYHEYFFFAYNKKVQDYYGSFQFVTLENNVWLSE